MHPSPPPIPSCTLIFLTKMDAETQTLSESKPTHGEPRFIDSSHTRDRSTVRPREKWFSEVPSTRLKPDGTWEILTEKGAETLIDHITSLASHTTEPGFLPPERFLCLVDQETVKKSMDTLWSRYCSKFSELVASTLSTISPDAVPCHRPHTMGGFAE